jgi:hypothetical protein
METEKNILWHDTKIVFILFAFVAICAFVLHKCYNRSPETFTPEIKGNFKSDSIVNTVITKETKYINSVDPKLKKENAFLQNQIDALLLENEKLNNQFAISPDTIKQIIYAKAIEPRLFNKTFDDEKVKIDVSGIAQGVVKSLNVDYTIKPIQIKKTVFTMNLGAEYGNSLELNKSVFKGNLEINNINFAYDTDKRIWIGGKINLFTIKR